MYNFLAKILLVNIFMRLHQYSHSIKPSYSLSSLPNITTDGRRFPTLSPPPRHALGPDVNTKNAGPEASTPADYHTRRWIDVHCTQTTQYVYFDSERSHGAAQNPSLARAESRLRRPSANKPPQIGHICVAVDGTSDSDTPGSRSGL